MNNNIHHLKTWPIYFNQIVAGNKTFELRKDDREFKVGDLLILEEWRPQTKRYTGNSITAKVTYILRDFTGLHSDMCIMSIKPIDNINPGILDKQL